MSILRTKLQLNIIMPTTQKDKNQNDEMKTAAKIIRLDLAKKISQELDNILTKYDLSIIESITILEWLKLTLVANIAIQDLERILTRLLNLENQFN